MIAFGRGGATETVIPAGGGRDPTGVWFEEQSSECLASAIEAFEPRAKDFSPGAGRRQAVPFNRRRFEEEILTYLAAVLRPGEMPLRKAA